MRLFIFSAVTVSLPLQVRCITHMHFGCVHRVRIWPAVCNKAKVLGIQL